MIDFILIAHFDGADRALEEWILAQLYLAGSTGSVSEGDGISAYFDTEDDRRRAIHDLSAVDGIEVEVADRERVDWLDRYQQSLESMEIGDRFIVAPDSSLIAACGTRFPLVIPQEQAFGTDSHETTSLCIELLENVVRPGDRGLDIGSGSGILALAMLRLGAQSVLAIDNDVDAFAALRANRVRNEVATASMPVVIGSPESLRKCSFDVVTMNILPDVIVSLLPDVRSRLARDARLILSGILIDRADEVIDRALDVGLRLDEKREKGEWWAGVFR